MYFINFANVASLHHAAAHGNVHNYYVIICILIQSTYIESEHIGYSV